MKYEIIYKNNKNFTYNYKDFLNKNELSWLYSLESLEIESYTFEKNINNDFSFLILENNIPLAFVPFYIKTLGQTNYMSWNDYYGYVISPVFDKSLMKKHKSKLEKECFEKIEKLIINHNIKKIKIFIDPYSEKNDHNYLKKYGYIDTSTSTCFVDLSLSLDQLWNNVRNSYRSLINQSIKKFNFEIVDSSSLNTKAHNMYKEFHHKTSKRITRPDETWDIQYSMVKKDKAALISLKNKKNYIAFGYFYHMNNTAFYGSASDDPEFETQSSIQHLIIWQAIKYYKKRNFKYLDLGVQDFKNQFWYEPSNKDLSISFFKRGFSSNYKNLFRGIKYYCKKTLEDDLIKKNFFLINNY